MNVAIVLHSHLPWLRRNGVFPAGEEWLFQAWSESYLPLVEVLERLAAGGARDLLTIGISPVLAEQMDDPYLLREFHGWLGRRVVDVQRTMIAYPGDDRAQLGRAWADHWQRQCRLLEQVEDRFLATGLLAPFRALADAGVIELLGGPATHPYLGLMDDAALLRGQLEAGLTTHERLFGRRPRGLWVPECSYRPGGTVADPTRPPLAVTADGTRHPDGGPEAPGTPHPDGGPEAPGTPHPDGGPEAPGTPQLQRSAVVLPGLEEFLAAADVGHVVLDGPTLVRGAGTAQQRDWAIVGGQVEPPGGDLDVLDRPVWIADSDVAAFGRNLAVTYAVWNPHGGYPTDPAYRDFFSVDLDGGFKSWRVTDRERLDKEPYDPVPATERAVAHAGEFVALLHRHLDPRPGESVVVAAYDTELFGHWWYEGPVWLETVLRRLIHDPGLRPVTLASYLAEHPPTRRLTLPESSWGWGKGHGAWVTDATRWLWQALREAEARFRALPSDAPGRDAAWRQLTLAQASDWPFMVVKDQAAAYAVERFRSHLERFDAACRGEHLDELADRDDPWGTRAPTLSPAPSRSGHPHPDPVP